jgi:hypothetical protein
MMLPNITKMRRVLAKEFEGSFCLLITLLTVINPIVYQLSSTDSLMKADCLAPVSSLPLSSIQSLLAKLRKT